MKKTGLFSAFLFCIYSVYAHSTDPVGARSAALGTASVALKDPWCTLNNQAGLASLRQITGAINYENRFLLKELGSRCATLALPIPTGTLGFSMTSSGYSLYHENRYQLAFAKAFSDKLSLGMGLNYFHTHIAEGNGDFSTLAGEIGIQVQIHKQLLWGIHLFNPVRNQSGTNHQEGLPVILKTGINYSFSSSVSFTLETAKELSKKAVFKGGIEYHPLPILFLRAGIHSDQARSAFGIGLLLHQFQLDLSASYHPTLGISSQLNLIYFFGQHDKAVRHDL